MVRRTALTGSLVVHGTIVLGAASFLLRGPSARPGASPRDVTIEVVAPVAPTPRAQPVLGPAAGPPSGRSMAVRTPRPVRGIAARAAAPPARTVETTMRIEPPSSGASEPGAGAGDGLGDATGGGHGGLGPGAGGPLDAAVIVGPLPLPPPAPAPAPSRARPPQLIYPARDREADDALLFVARLTIDPEGFVVGAHLVRGPGGRRDDQAASAVWRFRYRPALDADGRSIEATIEQRFLVE